MKTDKVIRVVWLMLLVVSLGQLGEGRSIAPLAKSHKLQKRFSQTLEETCPPPYEFLNEECNDTCTDDEHCPDNKMCCYDGCAHACMEPLSPPAVVDWLDYETDVKGKFTGNDGDEEPYPIIVEPIIESLDCEYEGETLRDGDGFTRGCYHCQCSGGYIMCEVGRCRNRVEARQETSGEGSEESSGDEELNARQESSGYSRQVIGEPTSDLEHKDPAANLEEEESGLYDGASSPDFMVYKSVKQKRKW